ncbi:transglycosylase domain-containing protein [Bifidobacterium saeculare]|uniref:transglycosylase domain-containing protein n=1 Tax=Bifidobacterium pullorum TaxID=78448 RepID=UPI0018741463|nr:transglycosylase domain-containing protein [Bifidobacterium pullorum]MBE5064546.1 transglycosylase domain-containing protein [Bifidobacterium pullorum subsp. saeculare]
MVSQTRTAKRTPAARHFGGGIHRSHGSKGPKPKGKSKHLILKWVLGITGALLALGIGAFAYLYATTEIPQPESIAVAENTTVYYADGTTPIGTFSEQNREIIDCSVLPDYVGQAVVASEDRSFYTNRGIDLVGIARAFWNNLTTGSRQGGSTITQQYAERYYLGETTSYLGKAREAILALKIAQAQDKDQVLCNYMNTIYLGRGTYGIQAAAKAYFGKEAKDLTVAEAAMLAGIIPSPSSWDPAVDPEQAQARFTRVLRIMQEDGYITAQEQQEAQFPQTVEYTQQNSYQGANGYLLQMVRDELTGDGTFSAEQLDTGGYAIVTTIDKSKQDLMYSVVSPAQNGMQGVIPDGMEFGGISVNAKDGSIISVYAGEDYLTKQLNQATQSVYEIGSTMKPMALLGAIQEGVNLDTVFNGNSPRKFDGIADPVGNFGNMSYGNVNLYTATAQSLNTVYMDVQAKLGTQRIAEIAKEAGAESDALDGTNPFTVLGNNALTTKDVARMYATIANQGNRPNIHIVSSVKNTDGEDIYKAPTDTTQVFDANDTALVTKAMTGTVQNGTATEALAVGHNLAMKTGTANDSYAASAVGFTPSVVSVFAMWYPDANGNPQEVPAFGGWSGGSDYPVHLFTQYMTQALAGTDNETFPNAVDHGKVGGSDGSWGLGSQTLQQMQEAQKKAEEEAQRKAEEEAQRKAEEEARRQQEQAEQERLEYCQNNPNDVSCGGSGNNGDEDGTGTGESDGDQPGGGTGGNTGGDEGANGASE